MNSVGHTVNRQHPEPQIARLASNSRHTTAHREQRKLGELTGE